MTIMLHRECLYKIQIYSEEGGGGDLKYEICDAAFTFLVPSRYIGRYWTSFQCFIIRINHNHVNKLFFKSREIRFNFTTGP